MMLQASVSSVVLARLAGRCAMVASGASAARRRTWRPRVEPDGHARREKHARAVGVLLKKRAADAAEDRDDGRNRQAQSSSRVGARPGNVEPGAARVVR